MILKNEAMGNSFGRWTCFIALNRGTQLDPHQRWFQLPTMQTCRASGGLKVTHVSNTIIVVSVLT